MIEIAEIDHALDLARDRAAAGLKAEARQTLQKIFDEVGWAGPEFVRAVRAIDTGGSVDWPAVREEALATVNTYIVRGLERAEKQREGAKRTNDQKKGNAADRLDPIRRMWRPGLSAQDVREKLSNQGEPFALRTIQRALKKLREQER